MKPSILFLEQQSWMGGAQRVLGEVLAATAETFTPIVVFPDRGAFHSDLIQLGIETITVPIGTYTSGQKHYRERLLFAVRSIFCARRLLSLIRRKRVSLVYINGPRWLPSGVLAARMAGVPCVFHLHLVLSRTYELFLIKHLVRYLTKIITCSRAAATPLLQYAPSCRVKIHILYDRLPRNFVALAQPARSDSGRITLGMVGRITRSKGQHHLLAALGRVPSELRQRTQIIIVGATAPDCLEDREYAEQLHQLAAQNQLSDGITWAGYQEDPQPYYRQMDALVIPSSNEALGLVALEALSHGIPVIASDVGGLKEIIQDNVNGWLIPVDNEQEWARALTLFAADESVRERLSRGALAGPGDRFSAAAFDQSIRRLLAGVCGIEAGSECCVGTA